MSKISLALSKRENARALKDDVDASYKELAAIFGISVQRVAMIERAALAKLRHPKNRKA